MAFKSSVPTSQASDRENQICYAALNRLAEPLGLPPGDRPTVVLDGRDPVLQTRYRVGAAATAAVAAIGIAASELWVRRGGKRQRVEVNLRHAAASLRFTRYFRIDGAPCPEPFGGFAGFYPTLDKKWVFIHGGYANIADAALRVLKVAADRNEVAEAVANWNGEALENAIYDAGGCATLTRTSEQWSIHPQAVALAPVPPVEVIRIGDAPAESLPSSDRPLSGVRVLDVTRVLAGPTAGRTLAEHGADVLKVSRPDLPSSGITEFANGMGKLSTFLDLRDARQAETLRGLVRTGDVFSQSYRPGALAALGFSPEDLMKIRPGIIYATLSAWGHVGPFRARRGYDSIVANASGMADLSGEGGRPRHLPASPQDYIAGYLLALGVMVALLRRAEEGGSWLVRTSLASAGQWIASLGLLTPQRLLKSSPLTAEEEAGFCVETVAPAHNLRHLRPVVRLSETPARWARPPSSLGADMPVWPVR